MKLPISFLNLTEKTSFITSKYWYFSSIKENGEKDFEREWRKEF